MWGAGGRWSIIFKKIKNDWSAHGHVGFDLSDTETTFAPGHFKMPLKNQTAGWINFFSGVPVRGAGQNKTSRCQTCLINIFFPTVKDGVQE